MAAISDPIVVLGTFRSGTSSVSIALASLGVFFGAPDDFFAADRSNEEGYWEHKRIAKLHRACLLELNVAQFDIDPFPAKWKELPTMERRLEQFREMVRAEFAGKGLWGWKDPDTSLLLPFTKEALSRLGIQGHAVICVRNPVDVAASQRRRSGADELRTIGEWLRRTLTCLESTIGGPRHVVVFEEYLKEPETALRRIVEGYPGWNPNEEQWAQALASQRKDLVHNAAGAEAMGALPSLVRETYELCVEAANRPDDLREGAFDERIRCMQREALAWRAMMRRTDQPRGVLRAAWAEGAGLKSHEESYEARREWVRVSVDVGAAAGKPVRVALYQPPGTVWIREAKWLGRQGEAVAGFTEGRQGALTEEEGIRRLWPRFGTDQLRLVAPSLGGSLKLQLEIMVETSVMSVGTLWRAVNQRLDETLGPDPLS